MEDNEARDKILRAFFRLGDYLNVETIVRETGVGVEQCRRILDAWTDSGVVFREKEGDAPPAYISRDALRRLMRSRG